MDLVKRVMPKAEMRTYESLQEVVDDERVTAVLSTLERAYYWSRVHPEFAAVQPQGIKTATVIVYAMPSGETDLRNLVDLWIETRRASGDADEAYEYWIRGTALNPRVPRWSVLRDVLGWRRP